MFYIAHYNSPLGRMTMASDGDKLIGLWFDGQKNFGGSLRAEASAQVNSGASGGESETDFDLTFIPVNRLPAFRETERWLNTYFDGKNPDFIPDIRLIGTAFQKMVWSALITIPYGETKSYSQLASLIALRRKIGIGANADSARTSPRAVGMAVGRNPISIIIPCHRIVGADGSLTGYAGGIDRKISLLALERVSLS